MKDIFYEPGGLVKYPGSLNPHFEIDHFISLRDNAAQKSPDYLPEEIQNAFNEGAACLSIGCNNAGATMFRLCVDLATRPLLPDPPPGDATKPQPNSRTRRDLGLRLTWLFDNNILPATLRELAKCTVRMPTTARTLGILARRTPRICSISPRHFLSA
jgi:hypothetical protein